MKKIICVMFTVLGLVLSALSYGEQAEECESVRQFTFSWQFSNECKMKPRGGTSRGAALELDETPHEGWLAIQEIGISDYEKDRRAILAMAGGYRTSFDFIEVAGFENNFTPDPPYQSWGTEYVYVVEDRGDFISLQHIMVMEYIAEDGKTKQTMVQKHWRQDWHYEKKQLMVFGGLDERHREKHGRSKVKGRWAQSVFQVDDSPRYEALGKWQHGNGVSTWISDETWRPVPRRETSFRKDYQVLIGTNRHTITPTGWVQEEANYKAVLNDDRSVRKYLSKELGLNRYERLKNFDFSEGDQYWESTQLFWSAVRSAWHDIEKNHKSFVMKTRVNNMPLFIPFFQKAAEIEQQKKGADKVDSAENFQEYKDWSLKTLEDYLEFSSQ